MFAIYINLFSRPDRMEQIEKELNNLDMKFERLCATHHARGAIGCTKSHIRALERALELGVEKVWILEDDYECLVSKEEFADVVANMPKCDVFLASSGLHQFKSSQYSGNYHKVIRSQTASSYMVTREYIPKLLENFKEGLRLFEYTGNSHLHALDMYWHKLQAEDCWLIYNKRLGRQRTSYSDVEKTMVTYNC